MRAYDNIRLLQRMAPLLNDKRDINAEGRDEAGSGGATSPNTLFTTENEDRTGEYRHRSSSRFSLLSSNNRRISKYIVASVPDRILLFAVTEEASTEAAKAIDKIGIISKEIAQEVGIPQWGLITILIGNETAFDESVIDLDRSKIIDPYYERMGESYIYILDQT